MVNLLAVPIFILYLSFFLMSLHHHVKIHLMETSPSFHFCIFRKHNFRSNGTSHHKLRWHHPKDRQLGSNDREGTGGGVEKNFQKKWSETKGVVGAAAGATTTTKWNGGKEWVVAIYNRCRWCCGAAEDCGLGIQFLWRDGGIESTIMWKQSNKYNGGGV